MNDKPEYPKKLTYEMLESIVKGITESQFVKPDFVFLGDALSPQAYEHVWKRAIPGFLYCYATDHGPSMLTGCGGVRDMCNALARAGASVALIEESICVVIDQKEINLWTITSTLFPQTQRHE